MSCVVQMRVDEPWGRAELNKERPVFMDCSEGYMKTSPNRGIPLWFSAKTKILTINIYITSEEFFLPWFHECGSEDICSTHIKMSIVIHAEYRESGCFPASTVCRRQTFSDFLSLTLFYLSTTWNLCSANRTHGYKAPNPWEMKFLHKQGMCTYTTHKSYI